MYNNKPIIEVLNKILLVYPLPMRRKVNKSKITIHIIVSMEIVSN